jgi:DHA2 family multidrug resistance protein-like MFS transporter
MQGTARLLGQTMGSVIMALLFTLTSPAAAPRIGLAVSAALALAGGLVSALRIDRDATRTDGSGETPLTRHGPPTNIH